MLRGFTYVSALMLFDYITVNLTVGAFYGFIIAYYKRRRKNE